MRRGKLWGLLGLALFLAGVGSHFASSAPDGLERVAADHGFADREAPSAAPSPMPDYSLPALGDSVLSGTLSGLSGTLIVLGLVLGLGSLMRRRPS